jgi:murein L,D-transpeptidase YcbB/YkuD
MTKTTRFWPGQIPVPLILTLLLLLTGLAQAQTTRQALQSSLTMRRMAQPADAAPDALYDFYARRDFQPAWSGTWRAEQAGAMVTETLSRSGEQGLQPSDYTATARQWDAPPASGVAAAAYDLSLTEDLLLYARHVRLGRVDPMRVYADVSLPPRVFDAGPAVNRALQDGAIDVFLAGLPPPHAEYRGLVAALARYRALQANGGWPQLPAKGARPQQILARLAAEDPMLAGVTEPSEETLRLAIMRFQARNGLGVDGRLGGATFTALNVPIRTRIEQIIVNMERWRWLPRQFEDRTVRVNVPDQLVEYYSRNQVLMTSRAAVGRQGSKTPLVRMMALSLVANPSWEVPGDIAQAQILPKLRKDPSYLANNNMVLLGAPPDDPHGLKIDWRQQKTMPYSIDQNPGERSAMGVLMLDSPNNFGVYLHDTPGKDVFRPAMRQKSNGCIRVEDMTALAAMVMTGGAQTTLGWLDEAVATGTTQRLMLIDPVPVYLLYWTALAGEDGQIGFRADFYGRDKPLLAALTGGRKPS